MVFVQEVLQFCVAVTNAVAVKLQDVASPEVKTCSTVTSDILALCSLGATRELTLPGPRSRRKESTRRGRYQRSGMLYVRRLRAAGRGRWWGRGLERDCESWMQEKNIGRFERLPSNVNENCGFCGSYGHQYENCRKRLGTCFKCGEGNHLARDCGPNMLWTNGDQNQTRRRFASTSPGKKRRRQSK